MNYPSGITIDLPLNGHQAKSSTGGNLYGSGQRAVILSNMNTNNQDEWRPLLQPLLDRGYLILTYDCLDPQADQWEVLLEGLYEHSPG